MATEPERKIEELLRAYAQKRRQEAGEGFELHPATRRILQAEVARLRTQERQPDSWLFVLSRLWPRAGLAFSILFLLAGICWLWQPWQAAKQPQFAAKLEPFQKKDSRPEPQNQIVRNTESTGVTSSLAAPRQKEELFAKAEQPSPSVAPSANAMAKAAERELNGTLETKSKAASRSASTLADSKVPAATATGPTAGAAAPAAPAVTFSAPVRAVAPATTPLAAPPTSPSRDKFRADLAGTAGNEKPLPQTTTTIAETDKVAKESLAKGYAADMLSEENRGKKLPAQSPPNTLGLAANAPTPSVLKDAPSRTLNNRLRGAAAPITTNTSQRELLRRAGGATELAANFSGRYTSVMAAPLPGGAYGGGGYGGGGYAGGGYGGRDNSSGGYRGGGYGMQKGALDPIPLAAYGRTANPTTVLDGFVLEIAGNKVRVVDKDGSIYQGSLTAGAPQLGTAYKSRNLQNEDVTAKGAEKLVQAGAEPAVKTFAFRATGTNITLNQSVVFEATLSPLLTAQTASGVPASASIDRFDRDSLLPAKPAAPVATTSPAVSSQAASARPPAADKLDLSKKPGANVTAQVEGKATIAGREVPIKAVRLAP